MSLLGLSEATHIKSHQYDSPDVNGTGMMSTGMQEWMGTSARPQHTQSYCNQGERGVDWASPGKNTPTGFPVPMLSPENSHAGNTTDWAGGGGRSCNHWWKKGPKPGKTAKILQSWFFWLSLLQAEVTGLCYHRWLRGGVTFDRRSLPNRN